ncbi:hypothetical protein CCHL11_06934 [Colletotrichum chlorophyti]|uniref:Uncharacterized protein n=1 Tax=Colletotrichum chlorophyti TaxID=708187 RepID=A0A1Q8RC17_9PEZI|nr:hypothetical protein CCHL11_06934 [Colletotrichum chlorophyti]
MHISSVFFFATLIAIALANLHSSAVCVNNRVSMPVGGTGWSVSYTWSTSYEISQTATKCACEAYRKRNTGNRQWDTCPDCTYDGIECNSAGWHMGGDQFTDYCTGCGAQGAEANK